MLYSLSDAENLTGRSKTSLRRDIKKGIFSASKNKEGQYEIDPAELARAYPEIRPPQPPPHEHNSAPRRAEHAPSGAPFDMEIKALEREIELKNQMLDQANNQIDDLRTRLDAEAEERRALTRLLTDQRQKTEERDEAERAAKERRLAALKAQKAAQDQRSKSFLSWLLGR